MCSMHWTHSEYQGDLTPSCSCLGMGAEKREECVFRSATLTVFRVFKAGETPGNFIRRSQQTQA